MIRLDTYGVKQVFKAGTGAYMPAKEGQSAASGTPEKQLIIRDYSKDALTTVDTYGDSVRYASRDMLWVGVILSLRSFLPSFLPSFEILLPNLPACPPAFLLDPRHMGG